MSTSFETHFGLTAKVANSTKTVCVAEIPVRIFLVDSRWVGGDWEIESVEFEGDTLDPNDDLFKAIDCDTYTHRLADEAWRLREKPVREHEAVA